VRDILPWQAGLLLCGSTQDVASQWEEFAASAQLFNVSWVDADGETSEFNWNPRESGGNVSDALEDLLVDENTAEDNCYIEYAPVPQG
jgi:hypothetical protein